jgi:hypothetical protein
MSNATTDAVYPNQATLVDSNPTLNLIPVNGNSRQFNQNKTSGNLECDQLKAGVK